MTGQRGWIIVLASLVVAAGTTDAQQGRPGVKREASVWRARTTVALEQLQGAGLPANAADEARNALLAVARDSPAGKSDALIDAALAWRLVSQLGSLPDAARRDSVSAMRASPEAGAEFVFGMHALDDGASAWRVFADLVRARAGEVERHGALAGAIALVHERGYEFHCNENTVKAPEPLAIFDYFSKAGPTLVFRPIDLPLELLTRVVDTTAEPQDMAWATTRHPQARDVGQRFHDVAYDHAHVATGSEKRVTAEGLTLRNIQKHGGVCADQAYYACGVGKALGVPTAYVTAKAAEGAHAWVGYFRLRGREGEWDFKDGRYDAYLGVRGWTKDPQTGQHLPDGALAITASQYGTSAQQRRTAIAWADASRALGETGGPAAARLSWLEHATKSAPGVRAIWDELAACGRQQPLSAAQVSNWIETVRRIFGAAHPDFLYDVGAALLRGVEDPRERATAWERMTRDFARRPDLLSAALVSVGDALEQQAQPDRALIVYQDVITKYTKDGLAVGQALRRADKLLTDRGRDGEAIRMFDLAWRRLPRPDVSAYFWPGSAWFTIGFMYADRLEQSGRRQDADRVRAEIGISPR